MLLFAATGLIRSNFARCTYSEASGCNIDYFDLAGDPGCTAFYLASAYNRRSREIANMCYPSSVQVQLSEQAV